MKFYLLIPLFFLGTLSLPIAAFTQENIPNQHPSISETPSSPDSLPDKHPGDLELQSDRDGETPRTWQADHERESDFQTKFFNMLFILGLLIGFMILASWALKRMMKTKMTQLNTGSSIKVLEARYLSPRATLYLVEIQNQTFLIAESPTSVTYLTTLPSEEEQTSTEIRRSR